MKYILHSLKTILFLLLLVAAIPHAMAQKSGKKPFTVVIDAGHGGVDPGALGKKSQEKNINFNVSNRLGKMINEAYPEVKVIYTRTTDVKIPLARRADIANKANANLFISIHSNASKNRNANGCQTFTLGAGSDAEAKAAAMYENEVILSEDNFEETYQGFDPRSSESYIIFELMRSHDMEMSVKLAEMVQKGMLKTTSLNDRGVSSAGFLVLHRTVMPSILVELGFITNSKDESLIASKEGQEKLAKGIFDGFANYYELYGRSKEARKSADTPTTAKKESSAKSGRPVFKIQIMVSESKLKSNDKRFKGLGTDYYQENGVYKYTYGESEDYNEILRMKKQIADKFKDAFIVAFLDGKKTDTRQAIELFKKQTK
jgi:N-acetylmuramoyl-L-alanine amidase